MREKRYPIAEALLDAKADVERISPYVIPLRLAVFKNDAPMVELFIRHGANLSGTNTGGCVPLHFAQSVEVSEQLLSEKGINCLKKVDRNGTAPLLASTVLPVIGMGHAKDEESHDGMVTRARNQPPSDLAFPSTLL